jgi:hypothetical protein
MRLASTVALALCVALATPIGANASDAVIRDPGVYGSFNPAATALAPPDAIAPGAPTMNSDDDHDDYDGLSRHRDQCNTGCIDN